MAYTEFYVRPDGSDLNAGSTDSAAAALTFASGNWASATRVFTIASGSTASINVNDLVSIYADGATQAAGVGRVSAKTSTTITLANALGGTYPTDGTGNRTIRIGGAWGTAKFGIEFPYAYTGGTVGLQPRVNFKNNATHNVTTAITRSNRGVRFEGFASAPGDGGIAVIDGGTTGASYVLLTVGANETVLANFTFQNNGATGSSTGLLINARVRMENVRATGMRGHGIEAGSGNLNVFEVEVDNCNLSNTAGTAGLAVGSNAILTGRRLVIHDNAGSNTQGLRISSGSVFLTDLIIDRNGSHGIFVNATLIFSISSATVHNNGGAGLAVNGNTQTVYLENSNFISNGTFGCDTTADNQIREVNCGFWGNTSGAVSSNYSTAANRTGVITYTSNPLASVGTGASPRGGNFIVNDALATGTGRGAFRQNSTHYNSTTTSYPDVGAGQHQDSGSGGGGTSGPRIGSNFIPQLLGGARG